MEGLAIIVVPQGVTIEDLKKIFSATLDRTSIDLANNTCGMYVYGAAELQEAAFGTSFLQKTEAQTLADNLVKYLGISSNPVAFITRFVSEYYSTRDMVTHEVVQTIASIKPNTIDAMYYKKHNLVFLIDQCKALLNQ